MRLSIMKLLAIFFLCSFSVKSFAAEILEQYLSVKALGMGNAYLGHATNEDAIFYNPAGLASMSGVRWRVAGLNLGLNGYDVYEDYKDIVDSAENDLQTALSSLYGQPMYGRTDFITTVSLGSLMIGAYGTGNVGFTLFNPALPNLQSGYFADYALFLGWGKEIVPNYLDFGFVGKRITRLGGDVQIGPMLIADLESDDFESTLKRSGSAYGFDFGMKLKIPSTWHPTFNFAWRNVGDTSFNLHADNPPPSPIENHIDVGVGFEKDFGLFSVKPAVDYRGLNKTGHTFAKKIHAGVELDFPGFSLRGGLNQGYYTAGLSMGLWIFELDVATYGVELGEFAGQQEDRRYIIQLSVDLGVDPSGDWFNMSRRRYRPSGLKQRR